MFIYPETKLRCDSCHWTGERKKLIYKGGVKKEENCPKCDMPLIRTDSGTPTLVKRNATALTH